MTVDIRPYTALDQEAVVEVMVLAEMFAREDAPFLEDALDRHLTSTREESRSLVASVDGRVLGAVLARAEEATDRVWDITMIGVRTDQQGHGIGQALMRAVESALIEGGARMILVRTSSTEQFAPARAFYLRLGYEQVAQVSDYWTEGDDLVVFRRTVQQS
ncbi:GNAT family N-acetyltransferase [Curtobacterium aurantiacum]|uniref:GNAT family N-acetyltransferase n=1 Tax=Curtobacterium aurantiacum TaxID=3236919 RepID=UPI001BDFF74E|nr:N-acetyltransferase [Curtobacterium flaccumfaciens]MBT1676389.1 GNAT family N-acetyltransferase [Curtobacterium flaccumfaciens pv. flaccumfaciens]